MLVLLLTGVTDDNLDGILEAIGIKYNLEQKRRKEVIPTPLCMFESDRNIRFTPTTPC